MVRVFVYGTLLTGGSAHWRIESFVRSADPGSVRASLVSAGEYPAMIVGADRGGIVHGEWLEVDEAALAVMDAWEDYYGPGDPRNLYERVAVTDADGTRSGLAYVWNDDRGCPPIPGGSWLAHLAGL